MTTPLTEVDTAQLKDVGTIIPTVDTPLADAPVLSWRELPKRLDRIADAPPVWHSTLHAEQWQIECYAGPFCEERESQDAFLVVREPGRDLLAVADGVTPTPRLAARRFKPDGAAFAARTVLLMIEQFHHLSLEKAFEGANRALLGIEVPPGSCMRDRPQAAAVAADVHYADSGAVQRVEICRAADCDVWMRCGGRWSLVTPNDMISESVREQLDRWDAEHRDATLDERLSFEKGLALDDPDSWNCSALGRFPTAKLGTDTLTDEIVGLTDLLVVTDGARLRRNEWRQASSPHVWLKQLRTWERRNLPVKRQHSDVAMLWLRRTGGALG